jgi:hypothetical protein
MASKPVTIDASLPFQFLGVRDYGSACCPHCGAEGRYIYTWAEFGKEYGAMAGCYELLTGKLKKDDVTKHIERIYVKQAKSKPLSGWDKTILRMIEYKDVNQNDAGKVSWAQGKITAAVSEAKSYAMRKAGGM